MKPSLAASFNRSCPRGAGRTSPAKPISPNTTKPLGNGLLRNEDTIASSTAKSAAGSVIFTPPTALMNTSWSKHATPACRCSTASSIAKRFCSNPTDRRRAVGACEASTSAWTSTSNGRVPSCVTMTQEPATSSLCCDRKIADGLVTPFSPFSVMANTPSSLTAPKRFLIARIRRNDDCVSPSKYNTVSTMCSSTRGPARLPSLVTWPTMISVMPVAFATRVSCAAHSRTCATEPGAEDNSPEYMV